MFEDVSSQKQPVNNQPPTGGNQPPQQSPPPAYNPPPNQATPGAGQAPVTPPPANDIPATAIPGKYEEDQELLELFKREKLSLTQKIIIIVISVLVIGSIIGAGIWLFFTLDPFAETTVPTVENTNSEINNNQQPHEIDTDGDGIYDAEERKRGLDPENEDTDGDLLYDYQEVKIYHTDPLVQDTDGDGYMDGEEVNNGYDPNGPGRLNE